MTRGVVDDGARQHCADLGAFVVASPSSFHAAAEIARRAVGAGFTLLREPEAWSLTPGGRYVVVRDGSAVVFRLPDDAGPTTPFTIIGTHTDSPGFKLKPRPTTGGHGFWQAGVEVYGGPLLNSWLDRELELAGRLVLLDGSEHLVRTGPLLRLPQLAIHLDRAVNDGLALDKQRHTQPVWGLGEVADADLLAALAPTGVDPAAIGGYDVVVADTQEPRAFGAGEALFASGRLDNLLSTHAALTALLTVTSPVVEPPPVVEPVETTPPPVVEPSPLVEQPSVVEPVETTIAVVAAFDHEEIGSESRSGAAGPLLKDVLTRIGAALGATAEDRARAFASSFHVSSDVGHGVHPNYPERHDPANQPRVGDGPILKINANQRYATDAYGAARWAAACAAAGVPFQEFVSNNAIPCGSTIGPITATRLGIRTVDVGVPILSMHSARELTAVVDPWYLSRAMAAVLAG
ncbi:Aspartyl aminopeptidase [Xylanimonas cellulosilytica DSM 15894]|uniref:M18 family aminopeptidase n=1 Tax=Xylanimonas cellulosilytica (strain DSM 15894 / JCM 12276 / CECT 5975 / KCTC 9989 / LMG 20990 / NBRC 107835 / XIL07) TaxID=446471 RepID=D1BVA1_XYLCX|nr:M18 family aminopeptidase [Xylanimonas cellulosilytica]ACZ29372.1 Aspartyl aminopeptidase [Xylanimonas cellulosilytica DSM 15894]